VVCHSVSALLLVVWLHKLYVESCFLDDCTAGRIMGTVNKVVVGPYVYLRISVFSVENVL